MVHIKKVEIFGFKSFGFKNISVDLRPGLVSISGPNGSGKSNILDAIIFALGENRPKQMRANKLADLIHDVEGRRRGTRLARCSVHFDNSDRKIPVDADNVEIIREMDEKGDNQYYLNKKKTQRNHIQSILDVANSGLHQLNVVQQGTITRISEFTPDEKRESIENLIGLVYFDDKKNEAMKQLSEADRKLEISFARMDEIKKRIDLLEEERNIKLRADLLKKEITRFESMSVSSKLRTTRTQKESKTKEIEDLKLKIQNLKKEFKQIQTQSHSLETKKNKFMDGVEKYNKAKADLDMSISKTLLKHQEFSSGVKMYKRQLDIIQNNLPRLSSEIKSHNKTISILGEKLDMLVNDEQKIESQKNILNNKIQQIDTDIDEILNVQNTTFTKKRQIDKKIKQLNGEINKIKLDILQTEFNENDIIKKIESNITKYDSYVTSLDKLVVIRTKLESVIEILETINSSLKSKLSDYDEKFERVELDIGEISNILEKSLVALNQYDSRIKTIQKIMHEDYTLSKLQNDGHKLGILGHVYDVLRWNSKYEHAAMAVCSDWLKAVVVKDISTMLGLSQVIKKRNLPRLKIITLDTISKHVDVVPSDKGVIGRMSDFVQCVNTFNLVKSFLFDNVLLVDSTKTAVEMSKQGFNTVTLSGEFFTANSKILVLDINSKVSNLTKIISMATSVKDLNNAITMLRRFKQQKLLKLEKTKNTVKKLGNSLSVNDTKLSNSKLNLETVLTKISSISQAQKYTQQRLDELEKEKQEFTDEHFTHELKITNLLENTTTIQNDVKIVTPKITVPLSQLNDNKSKLYKEQESVDIEYKKLTTQLIEVKSNLETTKSRLELCNDQYDDFNSDIEKTTPKLEKSISEYENTNEKLIQLREKEQILISSSGSSVEQIRDFDSVLGELNNQEHQHNKIINTIEKQLVTLEHELNDLKSSESILQKRTDEIGYVSTDIDFDVVTMQQKLQTELDRFEDINAKSPETYVEITQGYRSMSERKNSLEKERNSIVKFIEDVEKDKRQTFLHAFDTVDKEIRAIFSKMTKGNAWLELQNEDNIFSSGISYMIQFPNKPKRESTSISGGEKTLAAVVFVLALQKLKPSPFYLFDEIDAHLDAPNSERLAKILDERAKESQFIMVSLKDSVVQKASLIYGVYPKNGVSHIVSYKDKRLPYLDA